MQEIFDGFDLIPAITVAVFLLVQALKSVFPSLNRFLPAISGGLGLIIAVVCRVFIPESLPDCDLLSCIVCGIVSGFAATGVHQLKKTATGTQEANTDKEDEE